MCGSMTSHTWPGRDVSQLPSVPIKVSTPSLDYMILGHFHTSDFSSSDLLKDLTINSSAISLTGLTEVCHRLTDHNIPHEISPHLAECGICNRPECERRCTLLVQLVWCREQLDVIPLVPWNATR